MRHFDFIINEGYPEAQKEFAVASGDATLSSEVIGQFRTLVNRNQVQGNERNIDWWRKQGWQPFSQFVAQKLQQPSKTQVKRSKVAGRSITLMENDQWLVVIPLDKEASCFHGKNSDWCTTKQFQPYFEQYFYDREVTLIYCLQKQTGDMFAIAAHRKLEGKWEIFDQQDRTMSDQLFLNRTGLDAKRIVDIALSDVHQPEIQKSRTAYKDSLELTEKLYNEWFRTPINERPRRIPELEKQLLYNKEPYSCQLYVEEVAKTIAQQTKKEMYSRSYGFYVIDATEFPEAISIAAIQRSASTVRFFYNPTERMQMATIEEDPMNIRMISEPTLKVQIAAVDSELAAAQFIENPDPELFRQFPAINNLLRFMPDKEYEKFLPRVHDLIQEAMDEVIWNWEGDDDYFREWQTEQARDYGYLLFPDGTPYEGDPDDLENELEERELDIRDMDVDWERVHQHDKLNDYLEFNLDAKYFYRDVRKVLDNLTPQNIKKWSTEYLEENGDMEYAPEVSDIDRILAWKFKEQDVEIMGNMVGDKLLVKRNAAPAHLGEPTYRVEWIRD